MKKIKKYVGKCTINYKRLERRIMEGSEQVPNNIKSQLDEIIDVCNFQFHAKVAMYSENDIEFVEDKAYFEDIEFELGDLASHYLQTDIAGLYVLTIGNELENLSSTNFEKKNFILGWIYFQLGSELAESSAEELQKVLESEYSTKILRISPGYGDWDISEQKKIFNILKPQDIGVLLTENCLMIPEKSISGIIGKSEEPLCKRYCENCNKTDCLYRD